MAQKKKLSINEADLLAMSEAFADYINLQASALNEQERERIPTWKLSVNILQSMHLLMKVCYRKYDGLTFEQFLQQLPEKYKTGKV